MTDLNVNINHNRHFTGELSKQFSVAEAEKARSFHQRLPNYEPTPLHDLSHLAKVFSLKNILVKDESYRFGLNAFKILGGVYAIARLLCDEFSFDINNCDLDTLKGHIKHTLTFATATDGNHGRGVAWAAQQLGQQAVVYMPKGSASERVNNIRALGAKCIVTDLNYDDTVRLVVEKSLNHGWKVVQDTAWPGYSEIPTWIMQGYSTLAVEAIEQIQNQEKVKPTHVILQAGVGAMAGGVLGFLAEKLGATNLKTIIVEPDKADCIYRSGLHEQGTMVNVDGELSTIMAGLACGEPNPLGWQVLRNCAHYFVSCEDKVAALGMRVLANPVENDPRIVSGESGAVGLGLIAALHYHKNKAELMAQLELDSNSVVLLINTEGDTDVEHYRDVVWQGKYALTR